MSEENKLDPMLLNLILTFHAAGMQHLGKLKNPMSDKIERNLMQAELTIDMLDMMKKKTDGNLTEEENNLLSKTINELKMNFMDEKEKSDEEESETADEAETTGTMDEAETTGTVDEAETTESIKSEATETADKSENAGETVDDEKESTD